MPDALEEFTRQTIKELLEEMSVDQLLAALTPETRAALFERLKADSSAPRTDSAEPKPGYEKGQSPDAR
ncbi:MAG TPA: hypothetical protein VKD72_21700 [Gemmataceae bacterium]|nr:hypothetical protein [Gemmataceae bacterium]